MATTRNDEKSGNIPDKDDRQPPEDNIPEKSKEKAEKMSKEDEEDLAHLMSLIMGHVDRLQSGRPKKPHEFVHVIPGGPVTMCVTCRKPVRGFKDACSKREFKISGMCQACQDDVFG